MDQKRFVLSSATALLAFAVSCSQPAENPVAPSSTTNSTAEALPADGSKLKVSAPVPVSPANNAQPDGGVVLVASKARGKFADITPSYEFEIRNSAGGVVYSRVTGGGAAGPDNVSHAVEGALEFDQPHTWRARASFGGEVGPWSVAASFRTPSGGYIRDNELFDPLTNGRTVGSPSGPTQFIPGKGVEFLAHSSFIRYQFGQTLDAGEFSMMVTGIDEGSPGDKSKVMSMQEGSGDITTNRYRFTAEKRGRSYTQPGAVTFRVISGNPDHNSGRVNDGARTVVPMNDESWYFWKITWGGNRASLEVRADNPSGRVLYASAVGMGGRAYSPNPHILFLGQPIGRGGELDATVPGMIIKNVWASSRPRPTFPGE